MQLASPIGAHETGRRKGRLRRSIARSGLLACRVKEVSRGLSCMPNTDRPRYIQVHQSDNVAIVVNEGGLPAGARFSSGLVLLEAVPEAHKVALETIPEGAPIVRYG